MFRLLSASELAADQRPSGVCLLDALALIYRVNYAHTNHRCTQVPARKSPKTDHKHEKRRLQLRATHGRVVYVRYAATGACGVAHAAHWKVLLSDMTAALFCHAQINIDIGRLPQTSQRLTSLERGLSVQHSDASCRCELKSPLRMTQSGARLVGFLQF